MTQYSCNPCTKNLFDYFLYSSELLGCCTGTPRIVILNMDLSGHSYEDIMRLTDNLSQRYVIGFGASSTVYKCILKSGKPLAVKKLYHNYQQSTREFEAELDTVGRIKHRNLVSLQGYSLSPHGNLLFYEFMENGSLWDLLHGMCHALSYIPILSFSLQSDGK